MVVPFFVCPAGASSDVTLAFEDAQGIPPFSRKETENKDDTDDTDDTDFLRTGIGLNMLE